MLEVVSFHLKLGKHVQKLIYESVPFAYFFYKKVGHQAKKCPKALEEKAKRKESVKLISNK